MKKFITHKVMNYIKKNTNYDEIKLKEVEYGLISLFINIPKFIIIILISLVLGILKEVIIFMLLFNILRSFAFGLHATKSWICLLSSTLIFICLPLICKYIYINNLIKFLICIVETLLMLKNSPADTKKKPIVNKKRRLRFKIISTILAIIFCISAIIIKNNFLSNCLIFALILENIMISPKVYKIFKLPYNNYITYLKEHPDFIK